MKGRRVKPSERKRKLIALVTALMMILSLTSLAAAFADTSYEDDTSTEYDYDLVNTEGDDDGDCEEAEYPCEDEEYVYEEAEYGYEPDYEAEEYVYVPAETVALERVMSSVLSAIEALERLMGIAPASCCDIPVNQPGNPGNGLNPEHPRFLELVLRDPTDAELNLNPNKIAMVYATITGSNSGAPINGYFYVYNNGWQRVPTGLLQWQTNPGILEFSFPLTAASSNGDDFAFNFQLRNNGNPSTIYFFGTILVPGGGFTPPSGCTCCDENDNCCYDEYDRCPCDDCTVCEKYPCECCPIHGTYPCDCPCCPDYPDCDCDKCCPDYPDCDCPCCPDYPDCSCPVVDTCDCENCTCVDCTCEADDCNCPIVDTCDVCGNDPCDCAPVAPQFINVWVLYFLEGEGLFADANELYGRLVPAAVNQYFYPNAYDKNELVDSDRVYEFIGWHVQIDGDPAAGDYIVGDRTIRETRFFIPAAATISPAVAFAAFAEEAELPAYAEIQFFAMWAVAEDTPQAGGGDGAGAGAGAGGAAGGGLPATGVEGNADIWSTLFMFAAIGAGFAIVYIVRGSKPAKVEVEETVTE